MDDVYVLCQPERARAVFDVLEEELRNHTGIRCNLGKTKVWNRAGVEPPRVRELQQSPSEPVWVGDHTLPEEQQGLKVLGTPLGTEAYQQRHGEKRLAEEKRFWDRIPELPDLQCAWLLLLSCASPRFNYTVRTLPPRAADGYAQGHDSGMWQVLTKLLGREDLADGLNSVHRLLATLPLRLGGCGLRAASRTKEAAYWASWADTLPMMDSRCPRLAQTLCRALEEGNSAASSLREAAEARRKLVREGFAECPTWEELRQGARPPQTEATELGEVSHGWQYCASSTTETYYRENVLTARLGRAHSALLHSQSGSCAGEHLTALPLEKDLKWKPEQLKTLLLRRLRLPLQVGARHCKCGQALDCFGDHRAACGTAGVLQTRAVPLERMWRRVCREAGGRVHRTGFLRDMNFGAVLPTDNRRLECLVDGLPYRHGAQVAVDCTLVSPLKRNGEARPRAHREAGAALVDSVRRKHTRYPELVNSTRCSLVVAGMEVGGRWGQEAVDFLKALAEGKANEALAQLRGSTYAAWLRRWKQKLAVAGMRAFVETLLHDTAWTAEVGEGDTPTLGQLLGQEAHQGPPECSRLGLR